jgi:membrane associated rhomboid family serine protease
MNMYCLFIFGDNTEDVLGRGWYLALLVAATFCGSLLSGLLGSRDMIPHVGASGGSFGVMIYYLLRFPKARFTYLFLFRFVHVPALTVLVLYSAIQVLGAVGQVSGAGGVDYLAHLGGGLMGLGFWLVERSRRAT